jgi:hypothetical protein
LTAGLAALVGFGLGAGTGFFLAGADLGAGALGIALTDGFAVTLALTGVLAGALAGSFPFGAGFRVGVAWAGVGLDLGRAAGVVGLAAVEAGFAVCKAAALGSGLG